MGGNDPIRPVQAPRVMPVPAGGRGEIRRHPHEDPQEEPAQERRKRPRGDKQRKEEGGIDDYV